jgi:hypothetical protein
MIHYAMAAQLGRGHSISLVHGVLRTPRWPRRLLSDATIDRIDMQALPWALLPAVTFVVITWVTVIWLALDRAPLFYDPVDHVSSALDFLNHPVEYLTREHQWYPPAVHVLLGAALALTRYDLDAAIAIVNVAFFAVLVAATLAIGAELWSRRVGAIAAVLVSFYPATFVHLRFPMLDLPLTAMVTVSLLALIKSRSFQDRRWSAAFGILAGLGCLTKQSYVFVAALPVLYVLFTAPRCKRTLVNLAIAGLPALLIALPWYLPRLHWFLGPWAEEQRAFARSRGDVGTFTPFGLIYYLVGTWHQTSLALALLWILTLPLFLQSERRALIVSWWAGTVALITLLDLKDSRFLMPALPAIALMTARGLCRLRYSSAVIAAVAAFGVVQLWAASFGVGWLPEGAPVSNGVYPGERLQPFTQNYLLVSADTSQPDSSGWGIADGLANLRGYVGVAGDKILYDAARLPHLLQTQKAGHSSTSVALASCEDLSQLALFDLVVVQVGGPGSPVGSGEYDDCIRGMEEVGRIPVSTRNLLKGVSYLGVFRPLAGQ